MDRRSSQNPGHHYSRRAAVQGLAAGAIGLSGLTLWSGPLGASRVLAEAVRRAPTAKSMIFLSLFGGPPHQDTFDLKEEAPAEIRGEFQSIATSLNGYRICEYLPKLARLAHLYTVIRSVTHEDNAHESAFYSLMTGWPHPQPNTNAKPSLIDYPNYGVVFEQLKPPDTAVPGFILAGGVTSGGIGQTAGFLDRSRGPYLIPQDANSPKFAVPDFTLDSDAGNSETGTSRLLKRRTLVEQFDAMARIADLKSPQQFSTIQSRAFEMLASSKLAQAFDLSHESLAHRDAYGRNPFGQNLLVARRLIEAGVPVVQVNWRNKGDGGLDTHYDNFNQCKGTLLPRFDSCLSSLLIDLSERGLLEQTLVVAAGEFGRTPRINDVAGRDHWPGCNSVILAGGGIKSGYVYGSSDRIGAYPATNPVGPWDVFATMLHCYGIDLETVIHDTSGRPHPLCKGIPIFDVLDDPARPQPRVTAVLKQPDITVQSQFVTPTKVEPTTTSYRAEQNPVDGSTILYIPGGEFVMGSDDYSIEGPPHAVRISPFWLARTCVTNGMYKAFTLATGYREQEFHNQHLVDPTLFYREDHPAVGVNYEDARAYCRWVGGRLPTEAEWEFAARGPEGRIYPWGHEPPFPGRAVYGLVLGHGGKTEPVGSFPGDCSPYGVLDLAGNLPQWCADWFGPYPTSTSPTLVDPQGIAQGINRVVRGGCWSYEARSLRATARMQQPPQQRLFTIGFRVAMDELEVMTPVDHRGSQSEKTTHPLAGLSGQGDSLQSAP